MIDALTPLLHTLNLWYSVRIRARMYRSVNLCQRAIGENGIYWLYRLARFIRCQQLTYYGKLA